MEAPKKKKNKSVITSEDEQDRISQLPDELIHRILSFVEAGEAVQTSLLSKRWKFIWTTLPFVDFDYYGDDAVVYKTNYKFITKFLSKRNQQSSISEFKLGILRKTPPGRLVENLVKYAIDHNVASISLSFYSIKRFYKLSTFSSNSLKKLNLRIQIDQVSDFWHLPALTTLHLRRHMNYDCELSYSVFTCLPALKTLALYDWDLSNPSASFGLPHLCFLCLSACKLPKTIWDFPALLTLNLIDAVLPNNMSDILSALFNLRNLNLDLIGCPMLPDLFISCPQLVNLNISTTGYKKGFVVLAPKLSKFSFSGIFPLTFGVSELKEVDIKLEYFFGEDKKYYPRFTSMLLGLGNASILTFDMGSIEALSEISNVLVGLPSPFYNLTYVKLPLGYMESSIPSPLKSYLLGGSPRATFVTELPQDNIIRQPATLSLTAETAVLEEPLVAPTKGLVDCQYTDKLVSVETVDMGIKEQPVVEIPLADAHRVRQIDFPAEGTSGNRVSSSERDYALWQGYEVNSQFVCLLDRIMQKYPETFEHFTTKNKKLRTARLNMMCTSLNDFTKIPMAEVDSEIIVFYRDIFANLQSQGFNLGWVLSRVDYIQHLRFSNPLITELHATDCLIDEAKSEVQDLQARVKLRSLQTLRAEKMTEIEKEFGSMGTKFAVGFIGDDLLSDP